MYRLASKNREDPNMSHTNPITYAYEKAGLVAKTLSFALLLAALLV